MERIRKQCLPVALMALGALAAAAPAQAVTVYQIRPAAPDPLLWVGAVGGRATLTVPSPTAGPTTQAWRFERAGGTTFEPWYRIRNNGSSPSACLASYVFPGGTFPIVQTSRGDCNPANPFTRYGWWQLRTVTNQPRAVGLLAYGRDGSRVRLHQYPGGSPDGADFCAGFYPPSQAGTQLRSLRCSGSLSQQFTLTRVNLP